MKNIAHYAICTKQYCAFCDIFRYCVLRKTVLILAQNKTKATPNTGGKDGEKEMRKYFTNCTTAEEAKDLYRKLAKQLHPDCGGDAEEFKRMSAEFSEVFESLKNTHRNAEGKTYTKETQQTAAEFMDIIEQLIHMTGCTVELIGSWIWVSGNTYEYREHLRNLKFNYSRQKKAWYYHEGAYHKKSKTHYSMDTLRTMWGSTEYETEEQEKITA